MRVGFEAGVPVSIDGERLGLVELIERAAELGARHGVGIVDHIEDRIVGLKVRDIYEVPAAAILMAAHRDLEKLVSTIHQNNFKRALEDKWAYLCYAGLWHEPLRDDLDAYMESANEHVTGEVTVKLYKGSATRGRPRARRTRSTTETLASFGESGGEFSQDASPGFIELFTLQSRLAYRVRNRDGRVDDQPAANEIEEDRQVASTVYEWLGRLVVRLAWLQYGRQIKIGAAAGALLLLAGGFLVARRVPPEG